MKSVSRGDTKKVCLLFNSLLPPVKSEKGERERRERGRREREKCLSLLKNNSLFLSLFLFSSFSFFLRYVLAVDSFFFSSLLHFYSWVKSSVGLLSLFPSFSGGDRTNTSVRLSLSLLRRERFGKRPLNPTISPNNA